MKIDSTILNILKIPEKFYYFGNNSIYDLLEQTGYFEIYNQIDELSILNSIIIYPECIKFWIRWSDDKRSHEGWYISNSDIGKFQVEYFPTNGEYKKVDCENIEIALSVFIKREIENIRQN